MSDAHIYAITLNNSFAHKKVATLAKDLMLLEHRSGANTTKIVNFVFIYVHISTRIDLKSQKTASMFS